MISLDRGEYFADHFGMVTEPHFQLYSRFLNNSGPERVGARLAFMETPLAVTKLKTLYRKLSNTVWDELGQDVLRPWREFKGAAIEVLLGDFMTEKVAREGKQIVTGEELIRGIRNSIMLYSDVERNGQHLHSKGKIYSCPDAVGVAVIPREMAILSSVYEFKAADEQHERQIKQAGILRRDLEDPDFVTILKEAVAEHFLIDDSRNMLVESRLSAELVTASNKAKRGERLSVLYDKVHSPEINPELFSFFVLKIMAGVIQKPGFTWDNLFIPVKSKK